MCHTSDRNSLLVNVSMSIILQLFLFIIIFAYKNRDTSLRLIDTLKLNGIEQINFWSLSFRLKFKKISSHKHIFT